MTLREIARLYQKTIGLPGPLRPVYRVAQNRGGVYTLGGTLYEDPAGTGANWNTSFFIGTLSPQQPASNEGIHFDTAEPTIQTLYIGQIFPPAEPGGLLRQVGQIIKLDASNGLDRVYNIAGATSNLPFALFGYEVPCFFLQTPPEP